MMSTASLFPDGIVGCVMEGGLRAKLFEVEVAPVLALVLALLIVGVVTACCAPGGCCCCAAAAVARPGPTMSETP